MAGTIFTSSVALNLKNTLQFICTDETNNIQSKLDYPKWMMNRPMGDNYEDDQEYAGGGLFAETAEGGEIAPLTITEGYSVRYTARKIAGKYVVTEEAMDDSKYNKVIQAVKRLNRSAWKTVDIDCTNLLVRATNASFPGPDGVALASTSHPLAAGGTFSNMLATPMAPSTTSWNAAIAQLDQMPDHDGLIEGYKAKAVLHPVQQRGIWTVLLGSAMDPAAGNYSAINVIKKYDNEIKRVQLKYWTNTETNWGIQTDADNGFQMRWRRKFRSRTWIDENQELMNYAMSGRFDNGTSDPRCLFFSNA
jgi:hypothetical protein